MKTEKYNVGGMSCTACSASVNRVITRLDGVTECDVNLITGKMMVTFDQQKVGQADFIRVVEKAGFTITPDKAKKEKPSTAKKHKPLFPIIISAVFSAILLYISMGQMFFENLPIPNFIDMVSNPYNYALTQLLLCVPALFYGRFFFTKGIPLLLKGHPNMDSLVAIGVGSSLIYSLAMTYMISSHPHAVHNLYFESVSVVITLVMLGKYLEEKSRRKTAAAIEKLIELSPDTATVIRNGKEYIVSTDEIELGETILVKSGSKIALDGFVKEGFSTVDESMLTGESLPIEKTVGDKVTGGSINLNGVLYIEVTHIGENTVLSRIVKFIEDAQSKKAPISKIADKVAGIFVPCVIIIAVISAFIWLISGKDISFVLKIFTSVLVIACPCALGLATPTAIMVGTGLGASNGILIRNGEVLETTHKIKTAVFDKTGTVTIGKASVTDIITDNKTELLEIASSAESVSDHPLSQAIIKYAKDNNISYGSRPLEFQNIGGKGIKCVINQHEVLIGKRNLLEENSVDTDEYKDKSESLSKQGKSLIFVAKDHKCLGFIAVADSLKENSVSVFRDLKNMGIKTVLLSGDNRLCAEHIAKILDADEVYSEVLPEQKADIINRIKLDSGPTMMIGDGINDAPALTCADVGCAIGSGSDIAIESADIVLMKSDISDVARAVNLSRLTIKNIKQNLFWAFCYNCICIPVAAGLLYAFGGPLLNPMIAGLAMSLSSVFVVGNALRLKNKKI